MQIFNELSNQQQVLHFLQFKHWLWNKKMIKDLPQNLCFQPAYNGKNFTNRVLCEDMLKKIITYYCPAYLRIKIKNFTQLNHEDLQAGVNINIILTINFRGIKPLIEARIKKMLRISFNRDDSVEVEESSHNMRPQCDGVYTFVIVKNVHTAMNPNVFISPFQILNLMMSLSIQDIQINRQMINQVIQGAKIQIKRLEMQKQLDQANMIENIKQNGNNVENFNSDHIIQKIKEEIEWLQKINTFEIRFNLMDTNVKKIKVNYSSEGTFGNYDLVQSGLSVEYTNYSVNKNVRQNKMKKLFSENETKNADYSLIRPFKYAHFQIPIYKFPMVTLGTIFIPLWLLGIITVGIYFQDDVLVDRVTSLSTLLIAFVEIISVIRQQLPPSPSVSLLEILVYAQIIGTCMLCLLQSIQRQIGAIEGSFSWYSSWQFITSVIILMGQIIVIFSLFIIHKCVWEPRYNKQQGGEKSMKFDYRKWQNIDCQKHFHRKIDNKLIKIAKVQKEFEKIKDYLLNLTQEQRQEIEQGLRQSKTNKNQDSFQQEFLNFFLNS